MIQYREIFTIIDSARGTLINQDGAKISREDLLPRLILADEVILYASFVNVKEENSVISLEPKVFDNSLAFKIIGDADNDNETAVMFSYSYLPEKSDLAKGVIAFCIKTNSARFADALKNVRSRKCDFVILGMGSNPISTVVLAKDHFIAENRPCENVVFEDVQPADMMTREELQLLLNSKSPANHTHSNYALEKHTHDAADIINLELPAESVYTAGAGIKIENNVISCTVSGGAESIIYTAGTGISIVDGVISCTVSPGGGAASGGGESYTAGDGIRISADNVISVNWNDVAKKSDIKTYSAGNGISISDDNKISIKGVQHFDEPQDGFIGLFTDENGLHFAGEALLVTKQELSDYVTNKQLGDINSILDEINGEEI